jgi:hypothetical protein
MSLTYQKVKMLKKLKKIIFELLGICPICGGFMVKLPNGKKICINCKMGEMMKIYHRGGK